MNLHLVAPWVILAVAFVILVITGHLSLSFH